MISIADLVYTNLMSDFALIIVALVFIFIFFGPHNKSKPKDDKKPGGGAPKK